MPLVPPAEPTPRDRLPLDKLKLPPGFQIEVYASGIAKARSLRVGKRGTVFVGSARSDKVYAIVDDGGRRRGESGRLGPAAAERARLSRRHALHRRSLANLQDRQCRGRARQSAEAGGDL